MVDAESSDSTVAIATAHGARVFVEPWRGFVYARRLALTHVRTAWTFMLDADEVLDPTLSAAIVNASPAEKTAGFIVFRTTSLCGKPIRGAGWGDEPVLRLFRTERACVEAQAAAGGTAHLHERWLVDGAVERLGGRLLHDSYPTVASYWQKFDRYTTIEAAGFAGDYRKLLRACAIAILRFPWLLLARRGYRDGWRGLLVSAGSALYPVAVAWKALRRAAT